jgi:hypothetical protein
MADQAFRRETRTQGEIVDRVFIGGEEAEFVFGKGSQLFPNAPVEIWGRTAARIVDDAGRKWFEMGFRMDHLLSGNAAAGWTDQGDYFRIDPQWSSDLATWHAGKFIPAPVPVIDLGGGMYEYWARAVHPSDAVLKSGLIRCSFGMPGLGNYPGQADSRNNPFTALTVAGVSLALGGFPYTMPADAGRMQTDLRVFYPDATVEATSDIVWAITIPGVSYTSYTQGSKVHWPGYYVADFFGNMTVLVDGYGFAGQMVDDLTGEAILHKCAFGRLKITAGSRYDPFS